jgi:hypothetical protein
MARPADRLERAYREVLDASGANFFRRLRDYQDVLTSDKMIRQAVAALREEAEAADENFVQADQGFVEELQALREELVQRAPHADDSGTPKPQVGGQPAPIRSAEAHEWAYTLANFDAIIDDSDSKVIIRQDLDHGRAGMLCAILDAKLTELRYPQQHPAPAVMTRTDDDQRPDSKICRTESAWSKGEKGPLTGRRRTHSSDPAISPSPGSSTRSSSSLRRSLGP